MSLKWINYTEDTNKEAKTATSTFLCSFYEYFNSRSLPRVGWSLPWDHNLVCTQVSAAPVSSVFDADYTKGYPVSVLVNVTINYSTLAKPERARRPNQAASWNIYTTSSIQSQTTNEFKNLSTGEREVWKTVYEEAQGKKVAEVPPLEMNSIFTRLHVHTYADFAYYNLINNSLAAVNSTNFIYWIVERWRTGLANLPYQVFIPYVDTADFDDSNGKWLCSEASIEQQSVNMFKYSFAFDYSLDGHNSPYGIKTDQYPEYDFRDLFAGMDITEPEDYPQFF